MQVKIELKDYLKPRIEAIIHSYDVNFYPGMVDELCTLFEETAKNIVPPKPFPDNFWPVRMRDFGDIQINSGTGNPLEPNVVYTGDNSQQDPKPMRPKEPDII